MALADASGVPYRRGGSDQLTGSEYEIYMARRLLPTNEPDIKRGARGVNLPTSMLDAAQTEAHVWIGRGLLALRDHRSAPRHLLRSGSHRSVAPPMPRLFASSCGPGFTYLLARRVVRLRTRALRIARGGADPTVRLGGSREGHSE